MARSNLEKFRSKAGHLAYSVGDMVCFLANTSILGPDYEEIGDNEMARSFYAFSHAAVSGVSAVIFGYRTEGAQNIPQDGPAILSCNHLHASDTVFVPSGIPNRHVVVVGRSGVMNKKIQGDLFKAWGAVTIKRPAKGERFSLEGLDLMKKAPDEGRLELVYDPTRTAGHRPGLPPRGVLRVAQDTEAPIIPTVIKGSDRLFKNYGVIVKYGEPLPPPTHRREHREYQQHLMEVKQEMFDSIPYGFEYGEPLAVELGADE